MDPKYGNLGRGENAPILEVMIFGFPPLITRPWDFSMNHSSFDWTSDIYESSDGLWWQ